MFAFYNLSNETVVIEAGEKLGQGIFMQYNTVMNDNASGERTGGFGSTSKEKGEFTLGITVLIVWLTLFLCVEFTFIGTINTEDID